jgi:hypothetical protein
LKVRREMNSGAQEQCSPVGHIVEIFTNQPRWAFLRTNLRPYI